MSEPLQIFVRNEKGTVWGPLAPATIELLLDNGLIPGRVQVALDGINYVFPGRVPNVRQYFPRTLWGDAIVPGPDLDAPPPPPPPVPTEMSGDAAAPVEAPAPASGPPAMAGPGAVAGAAPRAGPGAVASGGPRAGPGAVGAARVGPGGVARPRPSVAPHRPPPGKGPAPSAPVLEAEVLEAEVADQGPTLEAEVLEAEVLDAEVLPPEAPTQGAGSPRPQQAVDVRTQPGSPPRLTPAPPPIEAPSDMPLSGMLSDLGPLRLYYVAATGEATGLLTIKTTGQTLQLHFRKGSPEFFGSDHPDDDIGAFLMRQGLLTRDQHQQAQASKAKFGGELVAALFGLGIINPTGAFTQLAQRAQAILLKAMLAEVGTFTFEAIELPSHRAMPLGNKWGILTEQIRKVPIAELKRRLGEAMDMPVMKAGGRVEPGELKLTPQEARAYSHFDGVRSLRQLERDLPQDADNHARVAWYLQNLEAVSFAAVRVPAPARPAPAPKPAAAPAPEKPKTTPARPVAAVPKPPASAPKPGAAAKPGGPAKAAAPMPRLDQSPEARTQPGTPGPAIAARAAAAAKPAAPVDHVAELKELEKVAETFRKQTHFELLGVKRDADPGTVKTAYLKLARTWHPDTVPPNAPPELGKLKEEIFGRIGDAQRVLTDPKAREEYIAELEVGSGEKMDIARILGAEEFFRKGEILVKARKFVDAVKTLDEAIAGNPDEGEYYAWRGYAKFFTTADKKAMHQEALRDINLCIAKNPRCAPAFYFLGHIAKVMGELGEAKKQFKKCLELNPKHLDAEREIRMMK